VWLRAWYAGLMGVCVCVCALMFWFLLLYAMVHSCLLYSRKKKAYIISPLAGIFLVISMALSSMFKRINVKDLTSKVSVYTSATGDDFGSLPYYFIHLTTSA
jgi:hypothetical protein